MTPGAFFPQYMVHAIQAVAGIHALPAPVHAFFASNAKVQ
jgi:hypothetical protein